MNLSGVSGKHRKIPGSPRKVQRGAMVATMTSASTRRRPHQAVKEEENVLLVPDASSLFPLDGGNRFINCFDEFGAPRLIPSVVKELEDYEDASFDEDSILLEIGDRRWIVGELAKQLGGSPVHGGEKADDYWLMLAATIIAPSGVVNCKTVRLLCTDSRSPKFKQAATFIESLEWLGSDRTYYRNGQQIKVASVGRVELVDECVPAWKYAHTHGIWKFPARLNGVLDIGGGDSTGRLFASINGKPVIERRADAIAPGTKRLATLISAAIQKDFQHSPSEGTIMDAIADGSYLIQTGGMSGMDDYDFKPVFDRTLPRWIEEIKTAIGSKWKSDQAIWSQVGEVLICGGSAPLLTSVEESTNGRFKIARSPLIENFSQLINIYGMAL